MDKEEYRTLTNRDPFGYLIRDRLRWSPAKWGLVVMAVNAAVLFAGGGALGALIAYSGPPGLLQDISALYIALVMQPIIHAYYIWTILGARSLMSNLRASKVFGDDSGFDRSLVHFRMRLRSRWGPVGAMVSGAFITLLLLGTYLGWYPWNGGVGWLEHSTALVWIQVPIWFLTSYALFFGLYNVAVTVIALRSLFREQTIVLSPWHPDGCGGLRSISQYCVNLSLPIGAVGIGLSITAVQLAIWDALRVSYEVWLAIGAYVILAPLMFFLPLGTAHAAMRRAKDQALLFLARQFDEGYAHLGSALDGESALATKEAGSVEQVLDVGVRKLENLTKLYRFTEDFPVWPFDNPSLRRFLAVVGGAIAPAVIAAVVDLLLRWVV